MKKISIILMLLGYGVIISTVLTPGRTYNVVLGKDGYQPTQVTVRKGDSVKFATILNSDFWPASDPHPTHSLYPEFDPKHQLTSSEGWTFKFNNAGVWNYHDHVNANLRGEIIVEDKNPITWTFDKLIHWYKIRFQKHDTELLRQIESKCKNPNWDEHYKFDECWTSFFSGISNDFGAVESMRLIKEASIIGIISDSDCHNFADQVGIDAYWQYVLGHKFAINHDFSICYQGFFHGFMLEHVSHGQNFSESINFCESLDKKDWKTTSECYVGIGNGLTYYYWSLNDNNLENIVNQSIKECNKLDSQKDNCIYGVFGGIEHLFLGVHGSNLTVDQNDPFSICFRQQTAQYRDYCIEKVSRPLFSSLNYNVSTINIILNKISNPKIRQAIVVDFGDMISHFGSYEAVDIVSQAVMKCRSFNGYLSNSCLVGLFNNLFSNPDELSGKFKDFNCNLNIFNDNEKSVCIAKKQMATNP